MLSLLLALQAAPAVAPTPYRPAPATIVAEPVALLLTGFDRDDDARVTRAETTAGLAAITSGGEWASGIGYIAYADWSARWLGDRNGVPTPFDVDRDGNGRVTAAELSDRVAAIFDRLDADKDGVLTRAELLTIRRDAGGFRDGGAQRGERRMRRR